MREASPSKSHARILLVDDNKAGLIARKSVLEELGHEITIASSPSDAVEHFGQLKFDIVVTDFKMPAMNGIELIRQLRGIHPAIPVILISGFSEALGLNEESTGANIVIQKSAQEVAQLIRGVNRLIRAPRKPARAQGPTAARKKQKA
ncbi:MAG TPA: response regulator [Bryobacteraceae bacterium]|jgi:CheY-like chemotaxis protein|nr:response regulator [Bryobacteraceae bacterium]